MPKKFSLFLIVQTLFFIATFFTLGDYGISWDEPTHFKRGQGYLWFLLTGDNDYSRLAPYDLQRAQNDPEYHGRSIYQDDKHNAAFYRTIDGTHPPLADILSAATNMIFYQKLGWFGDIESYHLFEIFVASVGVTALFLFVYESFGLLAAVVSTILFATYPLFWAESHFNIKDPIETSWIILTLYFLWKGVKASSPFMIFLSSVFAGFALGTKFNVIFLPFIVGPWLLFVFKAHKKEFLTFIKDKRTILVGVLYPVTVFGIFYLSYPFLWESPIVNMGRVLTFYQRNALEPAFANALLSSWPLYALRWVVLTAPPLVLLGLVLSIIFVKELVGKYHGLVLLAFAWFSVSVLRVSIPGVNVYGGVRQIMEYIPAVSILAGVGLAYLMQILNIKYQKYILKFKNLNLFAGVFCILIFAFSIYPLIRLHPNENVYFNFLTGGLRGAVESGVPAAGNSFGNAYHQGALWINANAPDKAKLTILQGSALNIPKNKLRSNISLSGDYFSGINREGEYIMGLTFNWEHRQNFYAWEYVEKFLEPVYEVKVNGVHILKVWKNDLVHTRPEYKLEEKTFVGSMTLLKEANKVEVEIGGEVLLSRIILNYDSSIDCTQPKVSVVETSLDGKNWNRENDPLTFEQIGIRTDTFRPAWDNLTGGLKVSSGNTNLAKNQTIIYYIAAGKARFIRFILDNDLSCVLNNPQVKIIYLERN